MFCLQASNGWIKVRSRRFKYRLTIWLKMHSKGILYAECVNYVNDLFRKIAATVAAYATKGVYHGNPVLRNVSKSLSA